MDTYEVLMVEDIAKILRIAKNTIQSHRWQEKSGCPVFKKGKRLYAFASEFWKWFKGDSRFYNLGGIK